MSSEPIAVTVEDIKAARERIKDEIVVTPMMNSDNLEKMCGCNLFLKLESLQRCKAFKFRGALNKLRTLPEGSTVCAVSAGNHSQGVALAASICNCKSVIYMPENATNAKVNATKHYGGQVIQVGSCFDEAKAELEKAMEIHKDWIYVPPFDDKYIVAGAGTIGLEIMEDLPDVDTIVVPIGGGGLISGITVAVKAIKPSVRIVGVQMASCPYTYKRYAEDKNHTKVKLEKDAKTPLADGIAVKKAGEINYNIIFQLVDEIVIVNEDEVASSVSLLAERAKCITEGAGATPFAAILFKKFAYKPNEKIVGVVSGGNIPLQMLARCIERALFTAKTRLGLSVVLPYGTKHFVNLIEILAKYNADIVSCISSPHVDVVANKEHYVVIIDVPMPDTLTKIQAECEQKGWCLRVQNTAPLENDTINA